MVACVVFHRFALERVNGFEEKIVWTLVRCFIALRLNLRTKNDKMLCGGSSFAFHFSALELVSKM